ncbi:helix-turn-helix domain-containing protein [Rhodospirillales bacterium]|nr:helix-turn-helix domain-containing protein [Rhodospirillales bacterium]
MAADNRLSRGNLAVGIYLVDHFNKKKGVAWPSYRRLSECANISRSTAVESVNKLITLEFFTKVTKGGRGHSNRYTPNMKRVQPADPISTPDENEKGSAAPALGSPAHRHERVRPTGMEPTDPCEATSVAGEVVSPPLRGGSANATAPSGGTLDGFENFWKSYPKKEGIQSARSAYQNALTNGVSPDTLKSKASQYAEAKATVDPQYHKMPANWLKEQCWLEDPQPPTPKKERKPKSEVGKEAPSTAANDLLARRKKRMNGKPNNVSE